MLEFLPKSLRGQLLLGISGVSPFKTRIHFKPRRLATIEVMRAWLDWTPPKVITVLAFFF
jgi:hypothetical protein